MTRRKDKTVPDKDDASRFVTGVGGTWIPNTCTKGDLAVLLGMSIRTVTDWTSKGVMVPAPQRGRYLTLPSLHGYVDNIRQVAAGRATATGATLADERAKRESIERQISELKLAQMRGEVLTFAETSDEWTRLMQVVKVNVMALPSKARQTMPHITATDAQVLKDLCRDVLALMADEVEGGVVGASTVPDAD